MSFMNKLQPLLYRPENADELPFTKDNCTGRTTATILQLISTAMLFPETAIDVKKFSELDQPNRHLVGLKISGGYFDMIEDIIKKLDFKFLYLDRARAVLIYNIY